MTTLKEETIKGLEKDKTFNMSNFGEAKDIFSKNKGRKNYCGTASCVAGHIVAAGARLGRKVPKELLLAPFDKNGNYKGEPADQLMTKLGLIHTGDPTAATARYLWARSYGRERANKLDFYAETFAEGKNLDDVTPAEAIQHLYEV